MTNCGGAVGIEVGAFPPLLLFDVVMYTSRGGANPTFGGWNAAPEDGGGGGPAGGCVGMGGKNAEWMGSAEGGGCGGYADGCPWDG